MKKQQFLKVFRASELVVKLNLRGFNQGKTSKSVT
jgi:hypothetical protein